MVLDAKGLRALAHPVRVQLVGLLRKYGPSTATRLAERLGVSSGTASYHPGRPASPVGPSYRAPQSAKTCSQRGLCEQVFAD